MTAAASAPCGRTPLRVLLIPLEFTTWARARSWSYGGHFAFDEGLIANGARCTVLPALQEHPSSSPLSWLWHAPALLAGERFDQVWIWLTHNLYDQRFLEWLEQLAPVRVGVLMESLEYSEEEYQRFPHLGRRRAFVEAQAAHLTHVLAADEWDAAALSRRLGLRTMWCPATVPSWAVMAPDEVPSGPARFFGATYGRERADLLGHPSVAPLLVRGQPSEDATSLPAEFDALNAWSLDRLTHPDGPDRATLDQYAGALKSLRRDLFASWLGDLRSSSAVVNLPSLFRAYAGRVFETMACARPCVSWHVPGRPANDALFRDGRELLLFDHGDAGALAGHLERLALDPARRGDVAAAGRAAVATHHTATVRVRDVLTWIATGEEPWYHAGVHTHEVPAEPAGAALRRAALFIKPGYVARPAPAYFTDTSPCEIVYQPDVYGLAAVLARRGRCSTIIDVGCGRAWKLAALHPEFGIVGIDHGENLESCRSAYPFGTWLDGDLETDLALPLPDRVLQSAVVVCADVIEHLADPTALLRTLRSLLARAPIALLSTPERDLERGWTHAGPPANPCHVREWNLDELQQLAESAGLRVAHAALTASQDSDFALQTSLIVLCSPALPGGQVRDVADEARAFLDSRGRLIDRDTASPRDEADRQEIRAVVPVASNGIASAKAYARGAAPVVMQSTRNPAAEAHAWVERHRASLGQPTVIFGIGLGQHVVAWLDASPSSARVIVVEPCPAMTTLASQDDRLVALHAAGRFHIAGGWRDLKALMGETGESWSLADWPVYQQLAPRSWRAVQSLVRAQHGWQQAGLSNRAPFVRRPGLTIAALQEEDAGVRLPEFAGRPGSWPGGLEVLVVGLSARRTSCGGQVIRLGGQDAPVREVVPHVGKGGRAALRNVALMAAQFDNVLFLGSGVRVEAGLLERYAAAPDGVRLGRVAVEVRAARRTLADPRAIVSGHDRHVPLASACTSLFTAANSMVPTEMALAAGPFEEDAGAFMDAWFGARVAEACQSVVAVPSAAVTSPRPCSFQYPLDVARALGHCGLSLGTPAQEPPSARMARWHEVGWLEIGTSAGAEVAPPALA